MSDLGNPESSGGSQWVDQFRVRVVALGVAPPPPSSDNVLSRCNNVVVELADLDCRVGSAVYFSGSTAAANGLEKCQVVGLGP